MFEPSTCPKCGAKLPPNAPAGICPSCLLAVGLECQAESQQELPQAEPDAPTADSPVGGMGFVPPTAEDLAKRFTQLDIIELIGFGGMGAVYKARQPNLDRLVALKIIRPEGTHDPSFAERFNREAKTLARLSHQNIVTLHDFGQVALSTELDDAPQPLYYIVMEYIDGANLRQVMQAGEFSPEQALSIVPQICDALQFAHDEGVVHRDIKPENILLDRRGKVKIADFGLAKLASASPEDYTLTATHQVMGTLRYMAPEQMEGSHVVDHRADIYSLGVVFYEMLTGQVPAGHFDPPSKKVEVDVRLDQVVLRAMAHEPERRYQHASDVKTDVESISRESPHVAPQSSPKTRSSMVPPRTTQRLKRWSHFAVSICTFVLAVAGSWAPFTTWGTVYNDVSSTSFLAAGFAWWQGMLVCYSFIGVLLVLVATLPWRKVSTFRTAILALTSALALFGAGSFLNEHTKGTLPVQPFLDAASWGLEINGKSPITIHEAKVVTTVESGPYLSIGLAVGVLFLAAAEVALAGWFDFNHGSAQHIAANHTHETSDEPSPFSGRRDADSPEPPVELTRRPFGSIFAMMGLFGLGWLAVGALRNFGPAGLALGGLAMGLVVLAVLRWTCSYVPELRDELVQRARWQRWGALAAAAILFGLAIIALEYANVNALDGWYYHRVSDGVREPLASLTESYNEKTVQKLAIPAELVAHLDGDIALHGIDPNLPLRDAGLLAAGAAVLFFAAVAAVAGTRRYQYQWTNHLRPAFYVTFLLLLMLPLTVLGYMVLDSKKGWGVTKPEVFPLDTTVNDFRSRLNSWTNETGYEVSLNASGGQSGINYDSFHLIPISTLDRWQYGLGYVHRPLPPLCVTCLVSSDQIGKQAAVIVETPWAALDSPEETAWRSLVDNLHAAIEGKQYQRYDLASRGDLAPGPTVGCPAGRWRVGASCVGNRKADSSLRQELSYDFERS